MSLVMSASAISFSAGALQSTLRLKEHLSYKSNYFFQIAFSAPLLVSIIKPSIGQFQPPCSDPQFETSFVQKNVLACGGNATYVLEMAGGGHPLSASPASTQGFTFSSYGYDPSTGKVRFIDVAITSYSNFGSFYLEVQTPNGVCYIQGYVAECCNSSFQPDFIVVEEDLSNYGTVFDSKNILIMGDVTLAGTEFSFESCDIRLGADAQLLPASGAEMTFATTSLQPFCACRWDRIHLPDNSRILSFTGGSMKGGLRSIMATNEAPINLTGVEFTDNLISLYLEDFNGQPSSGNSWINSDGCIFDLTGGSGVYCYDQTKSRVDMSQFFPSTTNCNNPVVDIVCKQSSDIHLGAPTFSKNVFKNTPIAIDKTALSVNGGQVFVQNNDFSNVNAVCSFNDAKIIAGGSGSEVNKLTNSVIDLQTSSVFFNGNTHKGGTFSFEGPTYTQVATGYNFGSEIASNTFEDVTFQITGDYSTTNSYCRVYNNFFDDSAPFLKDFPDNSNGRLIFHSNTVEISKNITATTVEKCDGMTFVNNSLKSLVYYTPSGGTSHMGVSWKNTKDATVSNNYLENMNRGFNVDGSDNTGTQFTCNEFVNCYHGFYFDNTTISDQGSASQATDNCFQYFYAGSFPYGNSLEGFLSTTTNWYMRPPSTCTSTPQASSTNCYCVYHNVISLNVIDNATANACSVPGSFKRALGVHDNNGKTRNQFERPENISIYPNPSKQRVTVTSHISGWEDAKIYSLSGQLVRKFSLHGGKATINISSLKSGVYIVEVGQSRAKLLVH